jgi:light-regulated signal transduction histidine kinase (bacteriophytochrome)
MTVMQSCSCSREPKRVDTVPFWFLAPTLELSYTTKPNGTGVGLSVSRAIVDAHGGRIWAEPNADGGASFYFTLPQGGDDGDVPQ